MYKKQKGQARPGPEEGGGGDGGRGNGERGVCSTFVFKFAVSENQDSGRVRRARSTMADEREK